MVNSGIVNNGFGSVIVILLSEFKTTIPFNSARCIIKSQSLELYLGKKSFNPEVNETLFERLEPFDNNQLIISLSDLSSYISVVYV